MRQTDFSDAFATVVKRRREAKGLSKVGLAESAGLHQTYVGLVERGLRNPTLDTAHALARALGLPLSELIVEAERLAKRESKTPKQNSG